MESDNHGFESQLCFPLFLVSDGALGREGGRSKESVSMRVPSTNRSSGNLGFLSLIRWEEKMIDFKI